MESDLPGFDDQLRNHFKRFHTSYAFYVNVERAPEPEVVFVHMRLLTLAKDSANEPVFEIMPVQVHPQSKTNHWDPLVKDVALKGRTYEITFSSIERPKLLSELSTLLLDIGLNIEEAHAWSTTDGYSLVLFVVDGWSQEGTEELKIALESQILKAKDKMVPKQPLLGLVDQLSTVIDPFDTIKDI